MNAYRGEHTTRQRLTNPSRIGRVVLFIALIALFATAVMMFGAKFGLWEPGVGFTLYRTYSNTIAIGVFGLSLVALLAYTLRKERRGILYSAAALVIGMGLLTPMIVATVNPPVRSPPIHDITTDTVSPPEFLILDDNRPGARNTLEYAGEETARFQKSAYPDIVPIRTELEPDLAFERSLSVAKKLGWEIVGADENALRFEATARTPVFHFADDVVVVVTTETSGSRVDIRSVSRIGRSDQGVNAARIRSFTEAFEG